MLRRVWSACRSVADVAVVDCGFCLEEDDELSYDAVVARRNAATLVTLESADLLLMVGSADVVGVTRLVRGWHELAELARRRPGAVPTERRVVLTRGAIAGPPDAGARSRTGRRRARTAVLDAALVVPEDPSRSPGRLRRVGPWPRSLRARPPARCCATAGRGAARSAHLGSAACRRWRSWSRPRRSRDGLPKAGLSGAGVRVEPLGRGAQQPDVPGRARASRRGCCAARRRVRCCRPRTTSCASTACCRCSPTPSRRCASRASSRCARTPAVIGAPFYLMERGATGSSIRATLPRVARGDADCAARARARPGRRARRDPPRRLGAVRRRRHRASRRLPRPPADALGRAARGHPGGGRRGRRDGPRAARLRRRAGLAARPPARGGRAGARARRLQAGQRDRRRRR